MSIYTAITNQRDGNRRDVKVFEEYNKFTDPNLNAKIYKILPHLFMDCEYSVWVDGNIFPIKKEEDYIKLLEGNDIAVMRHPERDCIYEEAEFCIEKGKDVKENIKPQMDRYRNAGFPEHYGMAALGFIVRRHTPQMMMLCEKWWAEICAGSKRDQLSFPFVFDFNKVTLIDKNIWSNDLIIYKRHVS